MLEIRTVKSSAFHKFVLPDEYEVVIVLPLIDVEQARRIAEVMQRRTKVSGLLLLVEDDRRLGFVMVANLAYTRTRSRYFGYVAQDAFPGEGWLDCGLKTLKQSNCGLLAFNEGRFFGTVAVFGLATRKWLNSLYGKCLFYPGYVSHFADMELSVLAARTSNLVYNPNAVLMEVDYGKHLHGNNPEDEKLYRRRALTGFDGRIAPFPYT